MNEELSYEIRDFILEMLKRDFSLKVKVKSDYYGNNESVNVKLLYQGEVILEDEDYI